MSATVLVSTAEVGVQFIWQTLAPMLIMSQPVQSLATSIGVPCAVSGSALVGKARGCMPARKASRRSVFTARVSQNPRIGKVCDHCRRAARSALTLPRGKDAGLAMAKDLGWRSSL